MSYIDQQFSKAMQTSGAKRKRKVAVKKMTPEEKVQMIKARYGLSHGGTKQNKKKRKRKGKNK